MSVSVRCKTLKFQNAVLDARLAIHDYFLKTVVSEMYENIGQSLSFVHLQLSSWSAVNYQSAADISATKGLVAKSIKDMRLLCNWLYFNEAEAVEWTAWAEGIKETVKSLNLSGEPVRLRGKVENVRPDLRMLLFRTVQEILFAIKAQRFAYHTTRVAVTRTHIVIEVLYFGMRLSASDVDQAAKTDAGSAQPCTDRLQLVRGTLTSEALRDKKARLKLEVPLNLPLYE